MLTVFLSSFLAGSFMGQKDRIGSTVPPAMITSVSWLVWHGMSTFVGFNIRYLPFFFNCWDWLFHNAVVFVFRSRASFSQVLTSMAMFFKWRFSISLYWSFCLSSFPLFYTQLYIEDGFRQTFIIHSYDMANLSQLSSFDEGLSTKCPSTFKHFHIQYLIFPLDL